MVSDEKLLEDLQEFAEELGHTPTQRKMNEHGPWSGRTYKDHFGSWNGALREANLEINMDIGVTKEELIKDLQEFAEELGHTPIWSEMNDYGPRDSSTYYRRFGSWNNALKDAGMELNRSNKSASKESLIKDLKELKEELGRTPLRREMDDYGNWDSSTYETHFGTWNNALKDAGMKLNRNVSKKSLIKDLKELKQELGHTPTSREMNKHGPWNTKTYKDNFGSWNNSLRAAEIDVVHETKESTESDRIPFGEGYSEARKKCFSRDNYNCRACGNRSNIHCHHIIPRREFKNVSNSNTPDNLITLCASCHQKFEGRWKESDPETFAENAREYLNQKS